MKACALWACSLEPQPIHFTLMHRVSSGLGVLTQCSDSLPQARETLRSDRSVLTACSAQDSRALEPPSHAGRELNPDQVEGQGRIAESHTHSVLFSKDLLVRKRERLRSCICCVIPQVATTAHVVADVSQEPLASLPRG